MALNFDAINLFDFVVKKGNGVKGLVDSGISEVPELYIQPVHERFNKTNINAAQVVQLPLIDLSGLDGPEHDQVEKALVKAAETFGFFYVMNHGMPIQLLEELKDAAHKFFNQPAEKKSVYLRGVSPSPLVNYGTSFVPEKEKSFEWKDYFSMYYTSDDDALKYWPDHCREVALEYIKTSTKMARRIMKTLLKNVGVEPDDTMAETLMGVKVVNMNFFPICPDPGLTVGIGRHSDIGTITVLLQDDVGGLSIRVQDAGNNDEWLEIPPIPGALLINIGDSLQILSNGKYKSAEHRVRTTSTRSRVSVPFFLNPGPKVILRPLPQVVEKDGKAQYKECLFEDYKNNFFGHAYQGKKALDFVKITSP
ncbi:2-oxoglutarate (2OG) and Fe(II)-dependent oxygenase superfamily protein [Thalictrum thalictroides]|uniref:2-oxoglutarate (2OG) and Fe(II)-dependent oxygenase superfamily protein n=1 Tax=Thalictrum thalictroides TaxID=46969 RepID=A0A7J6X1F3_THATH|nr:2-oxoglutarate (2OG) and Fe(II)-dependent oxygenase superfamily protein [Thalictrum thalictroides]